MKTLFVVALGLGLVGFAAPIGRTDEKADAPKLEGKYALTGGKKNGTPIDDESKKGEYTFAADKVTIKGMGVTFVMSYKLDAKAKPINIDMEILEGPEGTKGTKAQGIIEIKGDVVKLAYTIDKDKRPKDFEGKDGFTFELMKAK